MDLEADYTPEELMLNHLIDENRAEQSDREIVMPWFKFLWETYRTVLDVLRNNNKVEPLYAMTAQRAFQFCIKYKRTTEFRRLCDLIRNHFNNLQKYKDQRDRPDLNLTDTQQLYLETRFEQLKAACTLEMWQEAFRTVEDIHELTKYLRKSPKPQMMMTYYGRLVKIFGVSGHDNYLAYCWLRLYALCKSHSKTMKEGDLSLMATAVVLSTLAVLPYERKALGRFDIEQESNQRIAGILSFNQDAKRDVRESLTREALMAEIRNRGLLRLVPQEVADLFHMMEADFYPMDICKRVGPLLDALPSFRGEFGAGGPIDVLDPAQFTSALRQLALLRMLQQVSTVYLSMKIPNLLKMISSQDFAVVEKVIVDAVRNEFLSIKIDHRNGTLHFGAQTLESEKVRGQLSLLAMRLNKAMCMLYPEVSPEAMAAKKSKVKHALSLLDEEHKRALSRKVLIERRKEEQERLALEQEQQEAMEKLRQQKITEEMERKRLAEESQRREEERIRKEIEQKELEEARALLEAAKAKKGKKSKITEDVKLDKKQLMEDVLSEQIKERQEQERKLQKQSKQMEYFERARREEEAPLLEAAYQRSLVEDKEYHAQLQAEFLEQHKKQWERDLEEKRRLQRMEFDKNEYQELLMDRRAAEFARLEAARRERVAEQRALRKSQRDLARRRAYVARMREMEDAYLNAVEEKRIREEEESRAQEIRPPTTDRYRPTPLAAADAAPAGMERGTLPSRTEGERWVRSEPPPVPERPVVAPAAPREEDKWTRRSAPPPPPPSAPRGDARGPPPSSQSFVPPHKRRGLGAPRADEDRPRQDSRPPPPPPRKGGERW